MRITSIAGRDGLTRIQPVRNPIDTTTASIGNLALDLTEGVELSEFSLRVDPQYQAIWCTLQPNGSPSITHTMIREAPDMQRAVRDLAANETAKGRPVKYYAMTSSIPGIFSLGGDLSFFSACIRTGNREALTTYAHACASALHVVTIAFDLPILTIALVNGDALGGGFESALAFDVIVAEKSAKFGLPEILFNLFPGMGAYSFLSRKLGSARAEKIILSGKIYDADELHDMGVVDIVAEDGRGREAVLDYMRRHVRRHPAHVNICKVRRRVQPLYLEELRDVTDIWVDAAMKLTESDLQKMERLASSQKRRLAQQGMAARR